MTTGPGWTAALRRFAGAAPNASPPPPAGRLRPPLSRLDALLAGLLGLCLLLAQRGAAAIWWIDDDLFNLRWVESQPLLGQLLDPERWRQLPFRMLTPALFVSFEADLAWFGPEPRAWHQHQLVAQGVAAAVFYLALRLWTGRPAALAAALAGFCSPPVAALAAALPVRHYIEGAILAFAAVVAWTLAVRASSRAAATGWAVVSALAYLGAALAKEVFVPLPLVLGVLPVAPRAVRLAALWPQGVSLAAYALYRRAMLGTWGGGYGWAVSLGDYPALLVALPGKLAAAALDPAPGFAAPLFAAELLGVAALLGRSRAELAALAAGALALLGPLLPVSTEVPSRYAAIPALALAAAAAVALERLSRRRPRLAKRLAGAVAALACSTLAVAWPQTLAQAERQSRENLAFLELGGGEALRSPSAPPGTMGELARLVEVRPAGAAAAATWFYDDLFLCQERADWQVWEYDPARAEVVPLSAPRISELRQGCSRVDPSLSLAARFSWRSGILRWRLDPPGEGGFRLIVAGGRAVLEVPSAGAFHLPGRRHLRLAVRRTTADGRTTVSPELELRAESEVEWEGAGEAGDGRPLRAR